MNTPTKFEWIVEDPFYSRIHNSMVRVDDFSNMYHGHINVVTNKYQDDGLHIEGLTDGMIEVLYREWFAYNSQFSDFLNNSTAPTP